MKAIGAAILATMLALTAAATGGAAAQAQSDAQRIIGGTQAPVGKWPFVVGLLNKSQPSNFDAHFCGGTLIRRNYVVTAAHCLVGMRAQDIQVLVGTTSLVKGGQRINVSSIVMHPSYNNTTYDNDIALLKLATAVTTIEPAYVIRETQMSRFAPALTTGYTVGWGDTDPSAVEAFPRYQRQVDVTIQSLSACNAPSSYDGDLTARMLCAGYFAGGKDACQGDSGGPLFVRDSAGAWRVLVGVVSFGEGCAVRNRPGIYARVASYYYWIESRIAASP